MVDNSPIKEKISFNKQEILDLFARISQEIAIAHDLDGNILYLNEGGLEITGYSKEEILTSSSIKINDLLPKRPGQSTEGGHYKEQFGTLKSSQKIQTILFGKNGLQIPVELTSVPILRDGKINGIFLVARDISKRKNANKERISTKNKFENLTKDINTGVAVIVDGKNYWVNKAFADIFGYEKKELIDKGVEFVIVEEAVSKLIERMEKRIIGENVLRNFETIGKRKDGSKIYLDVSAKVVDFEGKTAIQIVLRDITEKRTFREKLISEKKTTQNYLDTAKVMLLALNKRGCITYANRKCYEILGYEEKREHDGLLGMNWLENFIPQDERGQVKEVFKKIISGAEKHVKFFKNSIITKNGNKRTILWYNSVLEKDRKVIGTLSLGEDVTEKEIALNKLTESEENYKVLFEKSPIGIVVVDNQGILTECNIFAQSLSGFFKEDLLGKPFFELPFFNEEDLPKLKKLFFKALNGRKIDAFKLAINVKGEKRWIEAHISPIFINGKAKANKIQIVVRDITDKTKFEKDLLKTEERIESILKTAPIGIAFAKNRIIEFCNDKFCEILEYSREELIGQSTRINYPDDAEYERVGAHIYKQSETEGLGTIETVFKTKSGKLLNILLNLAPIDGKDTSKGVTACAVDITERKRERKKLIKSEKRYKTTFEHTGTAMAIIEEDTIISFINSEFERLSGYSKREIEGKKSWVSFVHPEDIGMMKKFHVERREGKSAPTKYKFRFFNKKGELRIAFLTIGMIPGTNKAIASIIDITETVKIDKISKLISDINELVARENKPEKVLSLTCNKMAKIYEAVFTSLIKNKKLIPVQSKGIKLESISKGVFRCPSVKKALNGETSRINVNSKLCRRCTKEKHKYVLSIPIIHDEILGVITFHSNINFTDFEIKLLEKLSKNIAFALKAYGTEEVKRKAFEQLASNLSQFENSADKLRNPLAAIISALELKDELGTEKALKIIEEHALRIENELDEMRKDEFRTFLLLEGI